jgi:GNS1/SUR4 family
MMSSPIPSLVICLLYVYVVEIGLPRFMENRKPMEFRNLMVAYNFAMVALSGYIFMEVNILSSLFHCTIDLVEIFFVRMMLV